MEAIKLNESDIQHIVNRIVNEQEHNTSWSMECEGDYTGTDLAVKSKCCMKKAGIDVSKIDAYYTAATSGDSNQKSTVGSDFATVAKCVGGSQIKI